MKSNWFKNNWLILVTGLVIGIAALVLGAHGNPGNMGFCIACFLRDTTGALGLHGAEVVQYFRPEIVGILLGSLIAAVAAKEFKGRGVAYCAACDGMFYKGKTVVVVGGGDTGNDCVGTCIRQGCKSVTQLEIMRKATGARTAKNPWPEWPRVCKTDYGQEEAIAIFGRDPRIYETTVSHLLRDAEGHLTGVETVLLGPDRKPLTGTEKLLPCQLLLIAVGFLGPQDYVPEAFGLTRTPCSTVQTAEGGYSTNIPGVFTAGDMRRGQSLVVWAIREGREAAWEVDRYLMGHGEWTELPLIQTD